MNHSLSLIIPVHNEARNINESIIKIYNYLIGLNIEFEILLCDNGSLDDTAIIAKQLTDQYPEVKFLSTQKRGIGIGIRTGMDNSSKDLIMFYAIDLPFGLEVIKDSIKACNSYQQLIIGSKYHPHSKTKFVLKRYLASRVYNILLNLLFDAKVRDSQGSLLFSNAEIKKIINYLDSDSPFLQTQILIYLKFAGNTIQEIPVEYLNFRNDSKIRLFRDGAKMS